MKKMLIISTLFSWALLLHAQKAATLPELVNPRYLVVDNQQVIISDYPHIYLYSPEDFNLKKKIGSEGQGPGEFYIPRDNMNLKERGLVISVCPDYIAASSVGRVSYFKRNGDFIRLTKTPSSINSKFILLDEKWMGFIPGKGKLSVFIFDSKLDKKVQILDCDYWLSFGSEKMYNFFDRASDTLLAAVQDNKIFITRGDSPDFAIDVFDFNGNKLDTIKHTIEKIKIPKSFVNRIHEYFRVKFRNRNSDYFIKNLNLPDYFPAVRDFSTADHKLYVVTFKKTAGKTKVLVFSTKGNFLRKILLPVKEKNPEQLFPFYFSKDKFYQLVENDETDNWELLETFF